MSSNPFLKRIEQRQNSGHGKKYEERMAKKTGAKLHPNSGAMRGAKSDASLGDFRLESKSSKKSTLPLELAWLVKITREAETCNQVPAVVVGFVDADGNPVSKKNAEWVMIPMWKFQELVG